MKGLDFNTFGLQLEKFLICRPAPDTWWSWLQPGFFGSSPYGVASDWDWVMGIGEGEMERVNDKEMVG